MTITETLVRSLAPVIRDYVAKSLQALVDRVQALEQRPPLPYKGIWDERSVYGEGQFVTHAGSMWVAKTASISRRPGTDDNWQLVVKRGADGRNAP